MSSPLLLLLLDSVSDDSLSELSAVFLIFFPFFRFVRLLLRAWPVLSSSDSLPESSPPLLCFSSFLFLSLRFLRRLSLLLLLSSVELSSSPCWLSESSLADSFFLARFLLFLELRLLGLACLLFFRLNEKESGYIFLLVSIIMLLSNYLDF